MTKFKHASLQAVLVAVQIATVTAPILPHAWKDVAVAAVALAQAILAAVNHGKVNGSLNSSLR